ncbi:hypothetical protein LXL04_019841 [Taraxacum kok-saghyz]
MNRGRSGFDEVWTAGASIGSESRRKAAVGWCLLTAILRCSRFIVFLFFSTATSDDFSANNLTKSSVALEITNRASALILLISLSSLIIRFTLPAVAQSLIVDERFANLKGIVYLSRLLVETGKIVIKLTLVLPVATVTVERCFSAMKLLKTDLRNRIGDDFMNDGLICSVEKQALIDVKIEDVMIRFRKMGQQKC